MSLYNVLLKDVCCCFPRNELFTYDVVCRVTELHLSTKLIMFVNAVVSEICKLNQNKEDKKKSISNLRPFLGIHFNQRYL